MTSADTLSDARKALQGMTTRGRCLLAAGLALTGCAAVLGQRDLLRAGVLLVALPLCAVAVVVRTRFRLACTRALSPGQAEAGGSTTVSLRLENLSRLTTGVLQLEDAVPHALGWPTRFTLGRVEPRGTRSTSYVLPTPVRGRYQVGPLRVHLHDPFGLCELERSFAATSELVVTPQVWPLPAVRLGGDRAAGGDSSSRSVSVSGSDDAATREYRHGDDLRKVHWRSTARVGELMVRREEQPFQTSATLLLDGRARAHSGSGAGSTYEWSVSAAASIGSALARAGFRLTLVDEHGESLAPDGVPLTETLLLDTLADAGTSRTTGLADAVVRLGPAGADGLLVAVLGALNPDDAQRLVRLRAGAGSAIAVLGSRPLRRGASDPRSEAADLLSTGAWRVLTVPVGGSLADAWLSAGARPVTARMPA